jgi:dienelactone hydrolase
MLQTLAFFVLGGLLALIIAAGLYVWWRISGAGVRKKKFAEHVEFIRPHMELITPPGEGPFPLIIQFHGCGGVRTIQGEYARLAARHGYAAAIVDSLTPRRIGYEEALERVCTGRALWGRERAADVYAAVQILSQDKRIDPERIAAAGWSHGGWSLLDALTLAKDNRPPDGLKDAPEAPLADLKAVMVFYPYNDFPARSRRRDWLSGIPVEALLVHGDTVATETASEIVFQRQRAHGASVLWEVVDGVTHGFDEPDHAPKSTLRYDQEKTDLARGRYLDFLYRRIGPPADSALEIPAIPRS